MKTENAGRRNASDPKTDFCKFCRLLYDRHLVSGVGGNMSVRAGDDFFLTPTGCSLRDIKPDAVVRVCASGKVLEGNEPTKDAGMHIGILTTKPDVNVVCHVHGAHIVAATSFFEPGPDTLPPLTPGFVAFAYPIPMIPFFVPGTQILAERVTEELTKKKTRAVLLQNHGLVTVGKDFREAINMAEEIDEAARIFVLTRGEAKVISKECIGKIRA